MRGPMSILMPISISLPDYLMSFVTKIFLIITIYGLCAGCALKDDQNVIDDINEYESQFEIRADQLNRSGRLINPGPDIGNMTWTTGWDHNGSILLEISTDNEDHVYSFANAVRDGQGSFILASERDLDNLRGQSFRVLQIDNSQINNSQGEITGTVLRVDRTILNEIKEAIVSQAILRDVTTTTQVEMLFHLVFAKAMHSYNLDLTDQRSREWIDELMHERRTYIGRSSVYWKKSGSDSFNENMGFNHRNNFDPYDPYSQRNDFGSYTATANNNLNTILEGNVNVNIDLISLTNNDPRIINIFFRQSAMSFKDLQQTRGINVFLGTDLEQLDISEYGSIYLRSKRFNPFHLAFELSASAFGTSANLNLEIFDLTPINPFQQISELQTVGGNISRIARRREGSFTKTIKRIGRGVKLPWDGLKWIGRLFTGDGRDDRYDYYYDPHIGRY